MFRNAQEANEAAWYDRKDELLHEIDCTVEVDVDSFSIRCPVSALKSVLRSQMFNLGSRTFSDIRDHRMKTPQGLPSLGWPTKEQLKSHFAVTIAPLILLVRIEEAEALRQLMKQAQRIKGITDTRILDQSKEAFLLRGNVPMTGSELYRFMEMINLKEFFIYAYGLKGKFSPQDIPDMNYDDSESPEILKIIHKLCSLSTLSFGALQEQRFDIAAEFQCPALAFVYRRKEFTLAKD